MVATGGMAVCIQDLVAVVLEEAEVAQVPLVVLVRVPLVAMVEILLSKVPHKEILLVVVVVLVGQEMEQMEVPLNMAEGAVVVLSEMPL
jgi:hypothetical protein